MKERWQEDLKQMKLELRRVNSEEELLEADVRWEMSGIHREDGPGGLICIDGRGWTLVPHQGSGPMMGDSQVWHISDPGFSASTQAKVPCRITASSNSGRARSINKSR